MSYAASRTISPFPVPDPSLSPACQLMAPTSILGILLESPFLPSPAPDYHI